jgi:peptidoglycan/LPS O-acetylase OafA/YrhL
MGADKHHKNERPARPTEHPLERGPLRWIGLRSYSLYLYLYLYLWHLPIIALALHHAPPVVPVWARIGGGVVIALVAAELSYRVVEQPVLRWRDRRRPEPVAALDAATAPRTRRRD